MDWPVIGTQALLVGEYLVKVAAVGVVPENRRPSSSTAWLLLILFLPVVGVPLFLLIGSPYVRGRRQQLQAKVNQLLAAATREEPLVPKGVEPDPALESVVRMARDLTGLPCVTGWNLGLYDDTHRFYTALAEAVGRARPYV